MLQPSETFSTNDRFAMLIKGWVALCPETGAQLSVSRGRSKYGNAPKYYLIVPNKTVEERGGLFSSYDWADEGRKVFRAWTEAEAIKIGNEKLVKILAKREGAK